MKKRLMPDFYNLTVKQLMDNRVWDLPLIEKNENISTVLNILGARNHIWVIDNKKNRKILGIITEHDILSILTPKDFAPYTFGHPDIRSIQYDTVKTAEDIMSTKMISCEPEEKIIDALKRMKKYQLRRLPVVKNKKIIGELTLRRLIRKYYDATQYSPITTEG